MKRLTKALALATAVTALFIGTDVMAQGGGGRGQGGAGGMGGRGNWDPEQMRQRFAERMREQLEITSDAEWNLIQGKIEKVTEAQRASRTGMMGMMGRGQGGGPGGGPGGAPADPALESLQKAIEAKAPADEIKTRLNAYRNSQKTKQADLQKARDELRGLLTARQEAQCVLMGLLD